MRVHELKCWQAEFDALRAGTKKHEVRLDDRDFAVGDVLHLREWDPARAQHTGRALHLRVTYVSPGGDWGLPRGLCVMSVESVPRSVRRHAEQRAARRGTPDAPR